MSEGRAEEPPPGDPLDEEREALWAASRVGTVEEFREHFDAFVARLRSSPALVAEPSDEVRQLVGRWWQEGKEHRNRHLGDVLMLCALELNAALGAAQHQGPGQ